MESHRGVPQAPLLFLLDVNNLQSVGFLNAGDSFSHLGFITQNKKGECALSAY